MKVLHIDRQSNWGGQLNRTLNDVAGLRSRGIDAALLTHTGSAAVVQARARGVPIYELPLRGGAAWVHLHRMWRLVVGEGFDLVHAHGARDHLFAVLVAALGTRCEVLRTRHNHQRLRSGFFSRLLYKRTAAVVGVSQWVCDLAAADGIDVHRLHVIHDSVDLHLFRPRPRSEARMRELGLDPEAVTFGLAARLDPRKGVDLVLQALRLVRDRSPDRLVQGLIVGRSPERYAELAAALGLGNSVVFTGDRRDVPELLACMDVFVMPSRQEALGTAIVEAMAAGLPVVGSDVGGIPESVSADVGYVIRSGDVEGLAAVLGDLAADPDKRRSMGLAARRRAEQLFSLDDMVDRTIELYERVLSKRPAPSCPH
jgi:glycosyltransferase involved in cell wall biosynthesis